MTDPADYKPPPQPPEWEHVPARRREREVTDDERLARRHAARAEELHASVHPADLPHASECTHACHIVAHHRQMAIVYAALAAL